MYDFGCMALYVWLWMYDFELYDFEYLTLDAWLWMYVFAILYFTLSDLGSPDFPHARLGTQLN
jgi:hypothetical protein